MGQLRLVVEVIVARNAPLGYVGCLRCTAKTHTVHCTVETDYRRECACLSCRPCATRAGFLFFLFFHVFSIIQPRADDQRVRESVWCMQQDLGIVSRASAEPADTTQRDKFTGA